MADDNRGPRDIHLLTTDALLADLIGGRAVALGGGEQLALGNCQVNLAEVKRPLPHLCAHAAAVAAAHT